MTDCRSVAWEELKKVQFIDCIPCDGRVFFSQPFFNKNDETFKIFIPQGDKLTWLYAVPYESCYYAESKLDESTDIYLPLIDTIGRHYSFDSVIKTLLAIIKDILNCAVAVEKYFIFLERYRNTQDVLTSSLVATELEYFFGNVRSLYDLLQDIINDLWIRATGKKLRDSFNRMVSRTDLRKKYGLPAPLITYYENTKSFFNKCCSIRDKIYHRGLDVQIIYCFEDGFALQKDSIFLSPIVSEFSDIWPQEKIKTNGMVSVLALLAYVNKELLNSLDAFCEALVQSIVPPPPISESYKLFLRSPFVYHLVKSENYIEKQWVSIQRNGKPFLKNL